MKIKEKILFFCKMKNITEYQFGDQIGLTKSQINHMMHGRTKLNEDVLTSIKKTFPDFDMNELFKNEDSVLMVMEDQAEYSTNDVTKSELLVAMKTAKTVLEKYI